MGRFIISIPAKMAAKNKDHQTEVTDLTASREASKLHSTY